MLTDSHCHLDRINLEHFGGSLDGLIEHAKTLGITRFLSVATSIQNYRKIAKLVANYPQVFSSVGIHPTEKPEDPKDIEAVATFSQVKKVIAIGETGLDYFHIPKEKADWQRSMFKEHINIAKHANKPLIIHSRNAREDTLAILTEGGYGSGVMHCFSEDWTTAKRALDLGFYISFSGVLTFKNAQNLREVAVKIPEDRLLVETDAPYLTPEPYRGKSNTPGYTYYVAERLAQIRGVTIEQISDATQKNFDCLFGLNKQPEENLTMPH